MPQEIDKNENSAEYKNFNNLDIPEEAEKAEITIEPEVQEEKDTFSAKGIVSIILSLVGCCYFAIPSIVAIFLSASAYKRNKKDITAQIGLIASIIVTLFWVATAVMYIVDPELRAQLADRLREVYGEYGMASGSDINEVLANIIKR